MRKENSVQSTLVVRTNDETNIIQFKNACVKILYQLGEGACGTVFVGEYKINNASSSSNVAVKMSKSNYFRFVENEYIVMNDMKSWNSAHLIKLIDHISDGKTECAIVMEYMELGCVYTSINNDEPVLWSTR